MHEGCYRPQHTPTTEVNGMTLCTFETTQPNVYRCTVCGAVVISHTANVYASCGTQPMGLGDMVKAGLEYVGITPERVAAVLGSCGGCDQRQAALNQLGQVIGIGVPHREEESPPAV